MRVLAAPLRALLGCFDFVFGKLSVRQMCLAGLRGKRKVSLQDVTPASAFRQLRGQHLALSSRQSVQHTHQSCHVPLSHFALLVISATLRREASFAFDRPLHEPATTIC